MQPNHLLLQAAMPTRMEKRRISQALALKGESLVYKWCEDPEGSGKANPLDRLEVIVGHALVHNPDAALAIVQKLEAMCLVALSAKATAARVLDLVAALQPKTAKEVGEGKDALAAALRQGVLTGDCDGASLLREIEEGERAFKNAAVQLRAAIARKEARDAE
jgi:hypothetical protein